MSTLENRKVLVTGGNRGLGLGIVEALVERRAKVTVLARDAASLAEVKRRLGVAIAIGDVTDPAIADNALREMRPDVLVLNAGILPTMGPLNELTWEDFSATWNHDTKAGFHWIQAALKLPLARGSRVLVSSSGAAVGGSPLSGGHAGAKRMLWLLAQYANGLATERDLGVRFQALVPMQMVGATAHGQHAASTYARKKGISVEKYLEGFGKPMSPREYGEHVATILTDERHDATLAFGIRGETGVLSLDK